MKKIIVILSVAAISFGFMPCKNEHDVKKIREFIQNEIKNSYTVTVIWYEKADKQEFIAASWEK